MLALNVASAGVPDSVVVSTIRAARFVLAGQVAAGGPVSGQVAALTEGVLKAMLMSKLKAVVAVVLVLGLIGTGATVLSYRTAAAQRDKPPIVGERAATPQKPEPEREKKGFSARSKEVGIVIPGRSAPPEVFPTQEEMRLLETAKRFCVTLRNHHGDKNANALREFIDPRYLRKHDLTERDLAVPMPALGAIFDLQLADDGQTVFCGVQTKANAKEPVKEVLLLRVSDYEGKGGTRYLSPPKAPDAKTGSFTPWILRTTL